MGKKVNYPYEAAERYNTTAGSSGTMTRSEAQKKAEREAYDRMQRAYENERKSGAGRGQAPASSYRKTKRKSGRD